MQFSEITAHLDQFERDFEAAQPSDRMVIRSELQKVIRGFKSQCLPVPGPLLRMEKKLEQDAFEDMFDNLPV